MCRAATPRRDPLAPLAHSPEPISVREAHVPSGPGSPLGQTLLSRFQATTTLVVRHGPPNARTCPLANNKDVAFDPLLDYVPLHADTAKTLFVK